MTRRQVKAVEALVVLERVGGESTSAELARTLALSRDSVHQLLLPLARGGWVAAGRGRLGGYRATKAAAKASILEVVSTFSRDVSGETTREAPRWLHRLERKADDAYRRVLSSITIGEIAERERAEKNALSWVI
ncbi:MAG: RrF2 family transcriptional regulator [Thermoanaerobaculia bacterium]